MAKRRPWATGTSGVAGLIALCALLLVAATPAAAHAQAQDPRLTWRTIRTAHFEVTYHEPLGLLARRAASVAERAQGRLTPVMGYTPRGRTRILLTDNSDAANGSATAIPYNVIRLFATGPEDLSTLDDYDDWLTELITHEHTHILHLDDISGIPALINAVVGKVYPPNAVLPGWFLEGFAVHEESAHTSAGRMRSSMFDMFLRMDSIEDRLLRLDQISNSVNRWPHGNARYLYGSRFVAHIAQHHGDAALAAMAHDHGDELIPYGVNRMARRATGRTFVELYEDFLADTRSHYAGIERQVRARGLRIGRRLTFHGEDLRSPRYLRDDRIAHWVADGDEPAQIRIVDPTGEQASERLLPVGGIASLSPHPAGRNVFLSATETHFDEYHFYDLFRLDLDAREAIRLTHGLRAREPDVSPDGSRIAYTVNGAATTHLAIADISDVAGTQEIAVRSRRFEQIYTPRWSPDGRFIAFSSWRRGGYRDIQLLDLGSGEVRDITYDRAIDSGPVFSPDGQTLYFSSDRSGIANILAFDMATGTTRQVTQVLGGAFQPDVRGDGRAIAYVGYTSHGFDLYEIGIGDENLLPVAADAPAREPADGHEEAVVAISEGYDPWPTLWPRSYSIDVLEGVSGTQLNVSFAGGDLAGYHQYSGLFTAGLVSEDHSFDFSWRFSRTPIPVRLRVFRRVAPRGGLFVAGEQRLWREQASGGEIGVTFNLPRALAAEGINLSYALTDSEKESPYGGRLDPNDPPPTLPPLGMRGAVRAGWFFSNVQRTTYDVSPSEGRIASLSMDVQHPLVGSPYRSLSVGWSVAQYLEAPWQEHHVIALRYGGGISGGDPGRDSYFAVGGFPDVSVLDGLLDSVFLGGVALRGYAPFDHAGPQFHLLQTEYRFPLYTFDRGIGTLPAYLSRLWMSAFADYGDAFSGTVDLSTFRLGLGVELHLSFLLGYYLPFTLRIGYGRGVHEGGIDQFYGHIGFEF